MSDWIEWKGGECPVSRGSMVHVLFRNGVIRYCQIIGTDTLVHPSLWTWGDSEWDIVKYAHNGKTTAIPTPSGLKSVEYGDRHGQLIDENKREELRTRAALAALTGILAHGGVDGPAAGYEHEHAVAYADKLIEELERRRG